MISNGGYALLIGVNDYSSVGPAAALKGSREDVLKLYWFARVLLGLPPENIRVLASPPLTAAEFYMTSPPPTEMSGEATQASIQAGVAWLAGRMAADGAAPGLLTFSGHGSYSKAQGPLLCPADVGADLAKGIAVRDLSRMESLQAIRERLTVVLDCCHVVGDAPASNLRTSTALAHDATADEVAADHADFDISERVLLAARPGQSAYQALLGKVFHGALTFALVTVAEQWKASQEPGSPGMHVSYKQLLKRVRKLLWALRMKQNVHLRVPEAPMSKRKAVRGLPFFGTHEGLTVKGPDAERDKAQVDAGWKYTFSIGSTPLAWVLATGANTVNITLGTYSSYPAAANTECWYVNTAALAGLNSTSPPINVTAAPLGTNTTVTVPTFAGGSYSGNGTSSTPLLDPGCTGNWGTAPSAGTATPFYYQGLDASGTTLWMRWDRTGTFGSYSLSQVVWYYMSGVLPQTMPSGSFLAKSSGPTGTFEASASS